VHDQHSPHHVFDQLAEQQPGQGASSSYIAFAENPLFALSDWRWRFRILLALTIVAEAPACRTASVIEGTLANPLPFIPAQILDHAR